MKYPRIWLWLAWFCLIFPSFGQDILATRELEDFESEPGEVYPFERWGQAGNAQFLAHEPILRLEDGSFALLWKPDKINSRLRQITRYNLLLEERWTLGWELDRNEYILGMMQRADTLLVLTSDYEFFQQQHLIRARRFDLEEGKALEAELIEVVQGRQYEEILYAPSPDGQRFALYYLGHEKALRRVGFSYTYVDHADELGYFAYKARHIFVSTYDARLRPTRQDTLTLPTRRHVLVGCDLDDQGNFYAYLFRRKGKGKVKVLYSPATGGETKMLSYDPDLRDVYDFLDGYRSHLPPELGRPGRVWWAFTDRKKRGKERGIKGYQVVLFDFEREEVDLRREVPITSTLLVAAEKQREAYHLRPMRRFDEYRVLDVMELPNDHCWLITQKYVYTNFNTTNMGYPRREHIEERAEELILFEFDAEGQIRQALVVPSVQYARNANERLGLYYEAHLDTANQILHLLTREASGEKMRRPDRLFFRQIDLRSGLVSPRQLLFEGERRNQYWVKAYTTWLTPVIATTLVLDGSNSTPLLISTNVVAEPRPAEEDTSAQREE
jgi:hypothetical protein